MPSVPPQPPNLPDHDQQKARSYEILENARRNAAKQQQYDSRATRTRLAALFTERFGGNPYDWQLDATEAILLGLDSIVIAGTGSGKTVPFMLALLHDSKKQAIIISPLSILQLDQVSLIPSILVP
ncbi:hypothetical protein CVT26_013879 [Gymnopilus dilepis]|uniref:DEAD/DEAH-box helicase domain-containing protein n=1 Tax=Gymnopilus dilepis TaxID=231916 RepID=A0A409Y6A8_9AGAR|nr:hypothetical protein CVT26_013879 [Gymnopilus dilepis]